MPLGEMNTSQTMLDFLTYVHLIDLKYDSVNVCLIHFHLQI